MVRKTEKESSSLEWLHRIREEHYQKTKDLPLKAWLKPVGLEKAARACQRLGLKVRLEERIVRPKGK